MGPIRPQHLRGRQEVSEAAEAGEGGGEFPIGIGRRLLAIAERGRLAIHSLDDLRTFDQLCLRAGEPHAFHLKIDTGIDRKSVV